MALQKAMKQGRNVYDVLAINETGGLIRFKGQRLQHGHKPALHTGFDHFERFRQDLPVLL